MLCAKREGWRSWDCSVWDDDREIAALPETLFREFGEVVIEGRPFNMGYRNGRFELREGERLVATAIKPAALRREFILVAGFERFILRAASMLGRDFVLEADGKGVGRFVEEGLLPGGLTADLPNEMPSERQLYRTCGTGRPRRG